MLDSFIIFSSDPAFRVSFILIMWQWEDLVSRLWFSATLIGPDYYYHYNSKALFNVLLCSSIALNHFLELDGTMSVWWIYLIAIVHLCEWWKERRSSLLISSACKGFRCCIFSLFFLTRPRSLNTTDIVVVFNALRYLKLYRNIFSVFYYRFQGGVGFDGKNRVDKQTIYVLLVHEGYTCSVVLKFSFGFPFPAT